jgi:hypothetical protein
MVKSNLLGFLVFKTSRLLQNIFNHFSVIVEILNNSLCILRSFFHFIGINQAPIIMQDIIAKESDFLRTGFTLHCDRPLGTSVVSQSDCNIWRAARA